MRSEAILNMTLPLTLVLICLLSAGLLAHPVPFGYASLTAMVGGACLLVAARWPLYRQGRFFDFGSRNLDPTHRMIYLAAFFMVWIGVVLALFLALPLWMSRQSGN